MVKETSISDPGRIRFDDIINSALQGKYLTKEEIVQLLLISERDDLDVLFSAADDVRKIAVGDEIYLRGIIEFSNFCSRNCLYCGLRRDNHAITRYRMPEEDILLSAHHIRKLKVSTVVLQSGEDESLNRDSLCRLITRIKEETGLIITLSVGERSFEDYRAFMEAGADRYLLKHETSSARIHRRLRPGAPFKNRLKCLYWLKELGYEVGTGIMVGLPLQSVDMLADDILFMQKMDADMLGIGPFITHSQTPLANCPNGDPDMVLKVIAIARLVTKTTNIPATTALGSLSSDARMKAMSCGANVIMPDFTPLEYKRLYDIYPGKTADNTDVETVMINLHAQITKLGRIIGQGSGHRKRGIM
jgi:biotin synthase